MGNVIPALVYQSEVNECGLACISMLAETQGIDLPLKELRERFPASAHGTSLARLCEILSEIGIAAYPVAFAHNELEALPLPAILHYGASHYVVLAYRKGKHVCVMNPAIGQQLLPVDALKADISGYAIVLDEDKEAQAKVAEKRAQEKPVGRFKIFESLSLKDTARLQGIYRLMVLTFIISLTLFIMPVMVSNAINQVFSSAGNVDFPYGFYLLTFVVSTALAFFVRVITERFNKGFILLNSASGFSRLLNNTIGYFEKRAPGEIFSRFSAWQMAAGQKIGLDNGLRTDWIIALIALCAMYYISPILALVSIVGVTCMGAISVWAIYRDRYYTQQLQEKSAAQNDFIMETIQGYSTIKSAGLDEMRKGKFAGLAWSLFTTMQKKNIYEQVKSSVYQLVGSLEMVIFMLLALPMLKHGTLSLGDFFAYNFIKQIFSSYITKIFYAIIQKNQLHVIDMRAEDLFSGAPEQPDASEHVSEVAFHDTLAYRDITFEYETDRPVLKNVSFALRQRECVAIVGESGAGKSTFLRMIAGLLTPQHGSIVVDGQPTHSQQVHKLFFLQSQEDILFSATVLQNITLYDPDYNAEKKARVEAILRGLGLDSVIGKLPGGLNALIRESHAALSLGQRQRLLLARALYSERPVLILDEPTANLDEKTAQKVMQTIVDHCREQNKTLITVTHSDTVLPLFDRVLCMENGQIRPQSALSVTVAETPVVQEKELPSSAVAY